MMTIDQLEDYMRRIFERALLPVDDDFHLPPSYVYSQINWAEREIEKKQAIEKSSLMAQATPGGRVMVAN